MVYKKKTSKAASPIRKYNGQAKDLVSDNEALKMTQTQKEALLRQEQQDKVQLIEKRKQDQAINLERRTTEIKRQQELKRAADLKAAQIKKQNEELKRFEKKVTPVKPVAPVVPRKAELKVPTVPDNLKPKDVTKELWKPEVPKVAERKTNVINPRNKTKFETPVIDQLPVKAPSKKHNYRIPEVKKPEYVPPVVEEKVEKKKIVKPVIQKRVYEKPKKVEEFMRRNVVEEPIYQEEYEIAKEERYVEKIEYFIQDEVEGTVHQEFLPYREDILAEIRDAKLKSIRQIDQQFKRGTEKRVYEVEDRERRSSPYRRRDEYYEEERSPRHYAKKTFEDREREEEYDEPEQYVNSQRKVSNYTEQPKKYTDEIERKQSFPSQARKVSDVKNNGPTMFDQYEDHDYISSAKVENKVNNYDQR